LKKEEEKCHVQKKMFPGEDRWNCHAQKWIKKEEENSMQ
jgi:hypothetical protein